MINVTNLARRNLENIMVVLLITFIFIVINVFKMVELSVVY